MSYQQYAATAELEWTADQQVQAFNQLAKKIQELLPSDVAADVFYRIAEDANILAKANDPKIVEELS